MKTKSFGDFPGWFREFQKSRRQKSRDVLHRRHPLQKSTAFLRAEGIRGCLASERRHPQICETVEGRKPLARQRYFVFDQRVSGWSDLTPGDHDMCHACRRPITAEDKQSPHYVEASPARTAATNTQKIKNTRLRRAQKQVELAKSPWRAYRG
ncbi:MAG: hypothetical protein R3C58_08315 [Parvularculaceae bacterium]